MSQVTNYFDSVKRKLLNAPLCVQFEISGRCVAKCVTCGVRNQKMNCHPKFSNIIKAIRSLSKNGVKAIRFTGGEPLLADRFPEIIDECKRLGIYVSITTTLLTTNQDKLNALLKVNKFKVSLSAVEDEYSNFFGIDNKFFRAVRKNMRWLNNNKKKFSINYTIFDKNYSVTSIKKFINFIKDYKVNYVTFFPALEYSHKKAEKIVKNFKKCSKLTTFKSNIDTIEKHFERRKDRKTIICHINKFHWHIKRNGDVYPCCMTGGEIGQKLNKMFLLGNIFKEDVKKIYKREYDIFKDKNLAKNDICKSCTQRYLMLNNDYEGFTKGGSFNEL